LSAGSGNPNGWSPSTKIVLGGWGITTLRYQDRFGFAALKAAHGLYRAKIKHLL